MARSQASDLLHARGCCEVKSGDMFISSLHAQTLKIVKLREYCFFLTSTVAQLPDGVLLPFGPPSNQEIARSTSFRSLFRTNHQLSVRSGIPFSFLFPFRAG
jgi:hypothetical protein